MSELFASIKAFIEKGNIIIFLLAVAAAIFTYQMLASEILWAVFTFCLSYAILHGINSFIQKYKENLHKTEENRKKQEAYNIKKQTEEAINQKEKDQNDARLRMIYASLPEEVKEGLVVLYNLPQTEGGFINSRIVQVDNTDTYQIVSNAYTQIRFNLNLEGLLDVRHSIQSEIISIDSNFYNIIEEMAKKKRR